MDIIIPNCFLIVLMKWFTIHRPVVGGKFWGNVTRVNMVIPTNSLAMVIRCGYIGIGFEFKRSHYGIHTGNFLTPPRRGANEVCEENRSELRFNHKPTKKWLKNQKNNLPLECHLRKEMGNAGMRPISANRVGTIDRRCLRGERLLPLSVWIDDRCSLRSRPYRNWFLSPQPPEGEIGFISLLNDARFCLLSFSPNVILLSCYPVGWTWYRSERSENPGGSGAKPPSKKIPIKTFGENLNVFEWNF